MPAVAALPPAGPAGEKDVPAFVNILSIIVQVAAGGVMGMLAYMLYQTSSVSPF